MSNLAISLEDHNSQDYLDDLRYDNEDHNKKMKLLNIEFIEHYKLIQARADSLRYYSSDEYYNSQEYQDELRDEYEDRIRNNWKDYRDSD